jgi:hypothetical protein
MELTREIIACMQTIRRRLRAETGLDIRISQPDAINQMLTACAASVSAESRRQGERLSQLSGLGVPPPAPVIPPAAPMPMLSEAELTAKYMQARYSGPLRG